MFHFQKEAWLEFDVSDTTSVSLQGQWKCRNGTCYRKQKHYLTSMSRGVKDFQYGQEIFPQWRNETARCLFSSKRPHGPKVLILLLFQTYLGYFYHLLLQFSFFVLIFCFFCTSLKYTGFKKSGNVILASCNKSNNANVQSEKLWYSLSERCHLEVTDSNTLVI